MSQDQQDDKAGGGKSSDTPRTDALEVLDSPERHKALWDLCATLERELAGVRKENELVEAENDKLRASARSAGGTNLPDAGPSPRADAFYAVRDGRIHRPGITAEQGYEFARGLDRMLLQLEKAAFARSAIPTSSEDKSPSSANTATVKEVRNEMAEFYASDALNTDERTVGNQLDCKVAEKLSRWIGMLR